MRKFKTQEELQQEQQMARGFYSTKMPTDKALAVYTRQSTKAQVVNNRESAEIQRDELLRMAVEDYGVLSVLKAKRQGMNLSTPTIW